MYNIMCPADKMYPFIFVQRVYTNLQCSCLVSCWQAINARHKTKEKAQRKTRTMIKRKTQISSE